MSKIKASFPRYTTGRPQRNKGIFGGLMNRIKGPQATVPGTPPAPIDPAPAGDLRTEFNLGVGSAASTAFPRYTTGRPQRIKGPQATVPGTPPAPIDPAPAGDLLGVGSAASAAFASQRVENPMLNQGGMGRFASLRQQLQGSQALQAPVAPPAPIQPAITAPQAPLAPSLPIAPPAPGLQPPTIGAISNTPPVAPIAPAVKPPAPVQAASAPVQQQTPGTPAPGAAPAATTGTANPIHKTSKYTLAPVSPEEQFKKTQSSMYQVNK